MLVFNNQAVLHSSVLMHLIVWLFSSSARWNHPGIDFKSFSTIWKLKHRQCFIYFTVWPFFRSCLFVCPTLCIGVLWFFPSRRTLAADNSFHDIDIFSLTSCPNWFVTSFGFYSGLSSWPKVVATGQVSANFTFPSILIQAHSSTDFWSWSIDEVEITVWWFNKKLSFQSCCFSDHSTLIRKQLWLVAWLSWAQVVLSLFFCAGLMLEKKCQWVACIVVTYNYFFIRLFFNDPRCIWPHLWQLQSPWEETEKLLL